MKHKVNKNKNNSSNCLDFGNWPQHQNDSVKGIKPQLLQLLDPGEDVDGDPDAENLQSRHRRQDAHPGDLVVLEPGVQLGAATILKIQFHKVKIA